ncbi:hypothetical protein T02_8983 [Trichinella nativa]|uniref:Uncharacterized protein n=1 Tax=Trichinella nativa TaxID=6335 RepID=A0A0V1LM37_9BILA|nr:hypothetical protein T02_8983 [Trichinella nativa]
MDNCTSLTNGNVPLFEKWIASYINCEIEFRKVNFDFELQYKTYQNITIFFLSKSYSNVQLLTHARSEKPLSLDKASTLGSNEQAIIIHLCILIKSGKEINWPDGWH